MHHFNAIMRHKMYTKCTQNVHNATQCNTMQHNATQRVIHAIAYMRWKSNDQQIRDEPKQIGTQNTSHAYSTSFTSSRLLVINNAECFTHLILYKYSYLYNN